MSLDFSNRGFEADLSDWGLNNANGTITRDESVSRWGVASMKHDMPAVSFSGSRRLDTGDGPIIGVAANTQYTVSVYVNGESGRLVRLNFSYYNGGTFISNPTGLSNETLDGTWQRISHTFTTPANTTNIRALGVIQPSTSPAAFIWHADGWQLDQAAAAQEYDGPDAGPSPAIEFVGASSGTTSASLTGTGWSPGDKALVIAYRDGSTTPPSLPSGWTNLGNSGANTNSSRIGHRTLQSGDTTSGTWSNATSVVIVVYRNVSGVGVVAGDGGSGTSISYPALSGMTANGGSWVVGVAGHRSTNTALETPPDGMVNRENVQDATDEASVHDTAGPVTAWAGDTVAVGGSTSGWRSWTIELLGEPPAGSNLTHDLSDTITLEDDPVVFDYELVANDQVALSDAVGRGAGLVRADTISLSDALGRAWSIQRAISDTITLEDDPAKTLGRLLEDLLTLSEQLDSSLGEGGSNLMLELADTISLLDSGAEFDFQVVIEDTLLLADALVKEIARSLVDSVALSDSLSKSVAKPLADMISLEDAVTKGVAVTRNDIVTFEDVLGKTYAIHATDEIALSDQTAKSLGLSRGDSIALADAIEILGGSQAHTLELADVISLTDDLARALNGVFQGGTDVQQRVRTIILGRFGIY